MPGSSATSEAPAAGAGRDLETLLASSAPELEIGGNRPLRLTREDQAWWVRRGKVELFAVRQVGGREVSRRHLGTAGEGELLFAVGAGGGDLELLAVGAAGTRLLTLEVAGLRRLAREEPQVLPALAGAVERWMEELLAGVVDSTPPQVFEELAAGTEVELGEEAPAARPGRRPVWVRHLAGETSFLGRPELTLAPAAYLLPVPRRAWLTCAGAARLSCVDTRLLLESGTLWEGLGRFHELYLRYLDLLFEEAAMAELERLEESYRLDERALAAASWRLASVLGREAPVVLSTDEEAEPLLAASRRVGAAQGIEIRPPVRSSGAGSALDRICDASRVRWRRVILRQDWWRRDNGPLLGFRLPAEEGAPRVPVALLPTSPRSYEEVAADGSRQEVTADVAEGLGGEGFMFYPPLPERPVGKMDLLRLAVRDRRRDLLTILGMGLLGGLLGLMVPLMTAQIVGNAIPGADRSLLVQITLALVVSAFAAAVFQVTRSLAVLRLGGKFDGTVQAAVWDRLLALPVTFFRRFTVGDLAERSMGIDQIRDLLVGDVTTSLLAAVFTLTSFALLFYYSWPLALLATALVALLLVVTGTLAYLQVRHQRKLFRLRGKISSLLFGLIHGISKLRVAGAERRAFALWAERFAEQRHATLAAQRMANLQVTFNAVYAVLTSLAIFAMVGVSASVGLSLAEFLAFNAAFGQFQAAALSILSVFSSVLLMVPIYERLSPVLEEVPEVDLSKIEAGELAGDVELTHVSFRYQSDGPLILDDVSFRARPGEMVALVGPSGAGKSTCLRLLLGFEEPSSGSIYYDGQDLPSLDVQSVRRQIGVVLQHGGLMSGDIYSNIVGATHLGMDAAWEAARLAGLDDDIRAMPMGMHTMVSEGGGTFSGGQRQRLMIARAIVHRPRILFFDEATSALDNRTQEIVSESLERLKATRIIVAHRLSTILNADRIYVFEAGRVVEVGTYSELVAQGGVFARLAERQIA